MRLRRKWIFVALALAAAVPGAARLIGGRDGPGVANAASAIDPMGLRLVADLTDKRLKMYEADTLVWQYPIAVGSPSYPTPPGNYAIRKLVWNPSWTPPPGSEWAKKYTPKEPGHPANPMKVVKIFFREPDYYIHGTAEVNSLGSAASHGCLRMDPEHVAEVARFVMEHGGQPREESWFWRIVHFRNEEKPIYLKNPIPLTVTR
jgi:murein L,D-transpeptidase YcbB/YkuD